MNFSFLIIMDWMEIIITLAGKGWVSQRDRERIWKIVKPFSFFLTLDCWIQIELEIEAAVCPFAEPLIFIYAQRNYLLEPCVASVRS